jgi:hypothetical protein
MDLQVELFLRDDSSTVPNPSNGSSTSALTFRWVPIVCRG